MNKRLHVVHDIGHDFFVRPKSFFWARSALHAATPGMAPLEAEMMKVWPRRLITQGGRGEQDAYTLHLRATLAGFRSKCERAGDREYEHKASEHI